ncbi:MAG: ATP-binding protein [Chloroflexota bacterium]
MNRLWVWISLLIGCVVILVAFFPVGYRMVSSYTHWVDRPAERVPFDERDPERYRDSLERRLWDYLFRTLVVGSLFGLAAGAWMARGLVAPLRALEAGARAVARREWGHRVPLRGSLEMKSVAQSFNQMAVELQRQEELRRNMLADVTHELRHPVHLLQGNLQAILDGVYPLDMEEIDRLLEQSHQLAALVDDLHELALAEAHELHLDLQEADLTALVANSVEVFQPIAALKQVALKTRLPDTPLACQIDVARIRQLIQNLLGNALRYTPEGGEVLVVLRQSGQQALLTVHDTGMGIAAENLPRVFDRFYRADEARSRELPGTGLGLAIAQAIVQSHGGQILVDSAGLNQGSSFIVELPLENGAVDR